MGHSSRSSSTIKSPSKHSRVFTPIQHTTSTTRMKYTFAILVIACAVAAANARYCRNRATCTDVFHRLSVQRGALGHVIEQTCNILRGSAHSACIGFIRRGDVRNELGRYHRYRYLQKRTYAGDRHLPSYASLR